MAFVATTPERVETVEAVRPRVAAAPPRFAYLVSQYPAYNHTFILREIRRLRELGFELRVASIAAADRPLDAMTAEEREEARETYYVKPVGVWGALKANLRAMATRPGAYARGLREAVRLAGWDAGRLVKYAAYFAEAIVFGEWMMRERLAHFHTHFSSTVGLLATRVYPIEMSMTIHGPAEFDEPTLSRLREKVAASRFVCTISSYARSQLMLNSATRDWSKLEVSPLGIDPRVFTTAPFRERPEPFEVICVGRLAPVKAQHLLVEAIARLRDEGRNVRLRLVGDGPDRASLEREVADRGLRDAVVLEGACNQDRVRELYRGADAFALASFAEGVPVVLMEAMAMEIPCVSTRITGVPELIRDGLDGLLVAPSNVDELVDAIGRLIDDPALRRRLGRSGRERVLERYDLATNVDRLAAIFASRLGGS